jgi:hypothetical protein
VKEAEKNRGKPATGHGEVARHITYAIEFVALLAFIFWLIYLAHHHWVF